MRLTLIRVAAICVFAALCVNADAFAQLTKLSVGYVGVTSDNAVAFIARETGIYAKNGLDVQLIYFNSGSTAVTALISKGSEARRFCRTPFHQRARRQRLYRQIV